MTMFRRSLLFPSCTHMRRHFPHDRGVANTQQECAKHRGPQIQEAHYHIATNYRHSQIYPISSYTVSDLCNWRLKIEVVTLFF
jgi:hypothetical protein